jgi:DNA polymerase III delta subunit
MLHVFSGSDVVETRSRALALVVLQSDAGASVHTMLPGHYADGAIRSISQSSSLFGGSECVVLDGLMEESAAHDELIASGELLAASPHSVVVIEGKLSAADIKELKPFATTWFESKTVEKERFNPFSMADALAKKDKKTLWLLLVRAREAGLAPEEIIGTLFWQLKSMRLAKLVGSAEDADMKDFPFNKAKSAARNFTAEELAQLSSSLVALYHEGHLGTDIDLALEKFVLEV